MLLSVVLPLLSFALSASATDDTFGKDDTHGAAATEVDECSEIGVDIMKLGGNAVDAIISSTLCVGVVAAYHSGIGGGGFGIVRFNTRYGHNYEMASGNETMYVNSTDPTASTIGGLSVGVPGEIRGWETLHARHGKLPWAILFQPAIQLARGGFKVTPDLAKYLNADNYPFLLKDPLWAEVYAPHGRLLRQGETAYRRRYANTLEKIAIFGADVFYHGTIAHNNAKAAVSQGGILTVNDLAGYSAIIRTPANITYRGHRIFSTIAPSSGSVVLSILKIFEGFPGNASDSDPAINLTTHRLIQATKFGYGQRTNYGDPAFTANVTELEKSVTLRRIVPVSHVATMDKSGMAVSLTTTVNLIWGSRVMTEDGIILNNEMDDFSSPGRSNSFGFAPSPTNFIRPGKRPQSSISSSIVEDASGALHLHYHLDMGLTASHAVHHGRWHDQLTATTYFEEARPDIGVAGIDNRTVNYLTSLGYNKTYSYVFGSTGHVITRSKDGVFEAASDPRALASGGAAY
ncbi:hypothetical protein EWM64_g1327 [Hericium alpestre]|uniref:Gamma-glutamyltransferase n=1 Tax=Hericium alpestre TaxID=135208 RepID=A0A4Z0A8P0_9AGAM|nr:hypothetical protein EWM64_g1327 [Hericium alpestre]